jgi:hypothetical protein
MYAVTTYAAVREVLSNDEVYARHTRNWPALRDGTVPADWPLMYAPGITIGPASLPVHLK